jgi:hypothetical protein
MTGTKFHKIWVDQCDACATIRAQYSLSAAFDYIVAEKLANFAEAAITNPEFARELPTFVAEVRRLFKAEELQAEMARHDRRSMAADRERDHDRADPDDDDPFAEFLAATTSNPSHFIAIKELLFAPVLGIS